jgi:hypothetical protein
VSQKERLSLQLVRSIVRASIEFYESERKLGDDVREIAFCTGAITALKVFMSMLEQGVNNEKE